MTDHKIHSVSEYISIVTRICSRQDDETSYMRWWFRGISNSEFKLQPRLYRACEGSRASQEPNIRLEFFNRALPYAPIVYARKYWDWYFLMQHYRVPTRLLDWTESALIALYFALYSRRDSFSSQPAIWMLNPFELNAISIERRQILAPTEFQIEQYLPPSYGAPIVGRLPIAICPQRADRRMTAQHSTFTLHGNVDAPIEDIPEFQQLLENDHLVRIIVDVPNEESFDALKHELVILGIRNSTIFPDLEGLGLDICEDFSPT